jgi:hypothetical protein
VLVQATIVNVGKMSSGCSGKQSASPNSFINSPRQNHCSQSNTPTSAPDADAETKRHSQDILISPSNQSVVIFRSVNWQGADSRSTPERLTPSPKAFGSDPVDKTTPAPLPRTANDTNVFTRSSNRHCPHSVSSGALGHEPDEQRPIRPCPQSHDNNDNNPPLFHPSPIRPHRRSTLLPLPENLSDERQAPPLFPHLPPAAQMPTQEGIQATISPSAAPLHPHAHTHASIRQTTSALPDEEPGGWSYAAVVAGTILRPPPPTLRASIPLRLWGVDPPGAAVSAEPVEGGDER